MADDRDDGDDDRMGTCVLRRGGEDAAEAAEGAHG